jgi:SAM-dependent methyltransferase
MNTICNVCACNLTSPIYQSVDNSSITTMNKIISGKTEVYFCEACSHLQTNELPNLVEYYAKEYEVNTASEESDQLYKVVDGKLIYRADHQAAVLLSKVDFAPGMRVLDYGCAGSPTLRKVIEAHPEVKPFLFDVTDRYIPSWEKFPQKAEWSTHQPDSAWHGTMDIVLSFYALEHVADLQQGLANIKALLKIGGTFYFVVPNAYNNIADFVVADHVNHFSRGSLLRMLEKHGFGNVDVDAESHEAAFVVKATLLTDPKFMLSPIESFDELRSAALDMAGYWHQIATRIRECEVTVGAAQVAVYGAGFYGNFIASTLIYSDNIACFVDRNQHLQGSNMNGKPILAPEQMPRNVTHVFVGMNPRIARSNIEAIDCWRDRQLSYFFL